MYSASIQSAEASVDVTDWLIFIDPRGHLRSASSSSLIVRRILLSTVGDRAFPVTAARVWNELPRHVTCARSQLRVSWQSYKDLSFQLFRDAHYYRTF